MVSQKASREERRLYPAIAAGLEFVMSPALKDRLDRFMGHTSATAIDGDISSLVKVSANITPGSSFYDPYQHARIIKYEDSLLRSQNHEFGLLADVEVTKKGYVVDGLIMAVNLLNYYDRDRLVHPPFFVEREPKPTLKLGLPLNPADFRARRRNLLTEFQSLKTDFSRGPVIKGVKTAPTEFFVTQPSVSLPLPPDIE